MQPSATSLFTKSTLLLIKPSYQSLINSVLVELKVSNFSKEMVIIVFLLGKWLDQQLMVSRVPSHHICHPLYVTDCKSGLYFLVDTGAEVSIIPSSAPDHNLHKNNLIIQAINKNPNNELR